MVVVGETKVEETKSILQDVEKSWSLLIHNMLRMLNISEKVRNPGGTVGGDLITFDNFSIESILYNILDLVSGAQANNRDAADLDIREAEDPAGPNSPQRSGVGGGEERLMRMPC